MENLKDQKDSKDLLRNLEQLLKDNNLNDYKYSLKDLFNSIILQKKILIFQL